MSSVTLVCKTPGFRRMGIAHPATETYPLDRWTAEQIAAFEADPNFTVIVDRGEAAPIPGVAPGAGFVGEAAFLGVMNTAFDRFIDQIDVRLRYVFGQIDAYRERSRLGSLQEAFRGPREEPLASATDAADLGAVPQVAKRDMILPSGKIIQPAAVEPADVAPGADVSDAVQDNGAGPAINDLGAKSDGTGPAAPIGTAEGMRPPVFDDARVQSIRAALAGLGPNFEPVSRADRKRLREALDFDPTPQEIAAARIEAVAPEAIVKT